MWTCSRLQSFGLSVKYVQGKIRLSPSEKVTDEIKEYVKQNREAIIEELNAGRPYSHDDLLTDSTDPNGCKAILYEVPNIGSFWIVANEDVRQELQADGLPCLLPEDLIYIKAGATHDDRVERLRQRVEIYSSDTFIALLASLPGATVTEEDNVNE